MLYQTSLLVRSRVTAVILCQVAPDGLIITNSYLHLQANLVFEECERIEIQNVIDDQGVIQSRESKVK